MFLPELDLARNIDLSNLGRLSRPYKLTFAVTYRCNSRCVNCGIWGKRPGEELSAGEIGTFFRKNGYFNWIDVTGGEIFLRDDILEVFDAIVDNSPRLYTLHFPTNGLLTDRIAEAAEHLGGRSGFKLIVSVSLDGPPAVHDRLRGVPGGWERAVGTFARLREMEGVEAYLGMTLCADNAGLLRQTIEAVGERVSGVGPGDFHINLAHRSEHYYSNGEVSLPKEDIAAAVGWFIGRRGWGTTPVKFLESRYLRLIGGYVGSGRSPLPCSALSASCFIDPAGTVYPCSIWGRPIGDLRSAGYDLGALWQTNAAKEAARQARGLRCPNCWTPCDAYPTILGNVLRR
jgi:Fe-coproporphyrin III synthase